MRKSEPTTDLYRAVTPGLHVRADDGDEGNGATVVDITFARFGVWNEIDSFHEGRFMERIAPGAFKKTIDERGDRVKILFNHGHDVLGELPIGRSTEIVERSEGPVATVELFDESPDVARLLPALRSDPPVLGASYRFRVVKQEMDDDPEPSDHNPLALPERTLTEIQLFELGPVTFPADEGTSVGVRSLTDRFHPPADIFNFPLTSSTAGSTVTVYSTRAGDTTNEPPDEGHSEDWQTAADERKRLLQLKGVNLE